MTTIILTTHAKEELKTFSFEDQLVVADAISAIEDDSYRGQRKIDFCVLEDKHQIWAVLVDYVWLAFYEVGGGDAVIFHLSLLSKFRRGQYTSGFYD